MFAFCACLVALGHFREVQLSFLIVGHTHDDIDQRFSVISNILKRQDILSLKQTLAQVETGARGRDMAFTSAELLKIYGIGVVSLQTTYTPRTMHGQERGFYTIFDSMYKTMNRGCSTKYIAPTCGPQREDIQL